MSTHRGIRSIGDNKWEIRVRLPFDPITGRYPEKSETIEGGIRDAIRRRDQIRVAAQQGKVKVNSYTVNQLMADYFRHIEGEKTPATIKGERSKWDAYGAGAIGPKKVNDLTARDMDLHFDSILDGRGVKPQTVNRYRSLMQAAFKKGVAWGYVAQSPVAGTTRRKERKADIKAAKLEWVMAMLGHLEQVDPATYHYLKLSLFTGARAGEIAALRVEDYDPENHTLTIDEALSEGQISSTKGNKSRTFILPPQAEKTIIDQIALQRSGGHLVPATAFLFSDDGGLTPWRPARITLIQARLRKRICPSCCYVGALRETVCENCGAVLGVYFRVHDLRHKITSMLLRRPEVSSKYVQHMMGWEDEQTMRRHYNDYDEDDAAAAVAAISQAFGS